MKRILSFLLLALSLLAAPAFAADFPTARVLFETGKTDVGPEGQAAIKAVADYVAANKDAKVQLSGFTDTTGDPAANAELAKNRASGCGNRASTGRRRGGICRSSYGCIRAAASYASRRWYPIR